MMADIWWELWSMSRGENLNLRMMIGDDELS